MKKILKITAFLLLGLMLVGTFVFLYNKTRPVKVTYTLVAPLYDTLQKEVVATGKIEPRDEVLIKPQVAGIISEIYKQTGELVQQGEVLAKVTVIPEMGSLNSAESRVNMARINREQTHREFLRTQQLHENGVLSREEFELSQTADQRAQEELQSAQNNLEIVQNGITARSAHLSTTQIRSTITGMILDVPVKVGNSVINSNTFNDGTTIATVADMKNMLFRGKVDETDVGRLTEGMPVELTIGAMQQVKLNAVMEYIAPKGSEENGIVQFEVRAAAQIPADLFVRAGYSANARIVIERRENVLTVPESLVEFAGDSTFVYLLQKGDNAEQQFQRHPITVGLSDGLRVEVVSGLQGDEQLRGESQTKTK